MRRRTRALTPAYRHRLVEGRRGVGCTVRSRAALGLALLATLAAADASAVEPSRSPDEPATEGDNSSDTAPNPAAPAAFLRLDAGLGWVRHSLSFKQDLYERLRRERANIYVYRVDAEAYPLLRSFGQRLGLVAGIEGRLSGSIEDADVGETYQVGYRDFYVGLRSRHPVGRHSLGFQLTYGQLTSGLTPPADRTGTPDFRYTSLRAGLDALVQLSGFSLMAKVGFQAPLGFGEIGRAPWFPQISGYGLEGGVGVRVPVGSGISLNARVEAQRYLLEMNSRPQDAVASTAEVAAGAVDLYIGSYVGAALAL